MKSVVIIAIAFGLKFQFYLSNVDHTENQLLINYFLDCRTSNN